LSSAQTASGAPGGAQRGALLDAQLRRFRGAHVRTVASLLLVDLATTGILTLVSRRYEAFASALVCSIAVFGIAGASLAWLQSRPLATREPARLPAYLRGLPALSALQAVALTLFYCLLAFNLGVFFPDAARLDRLPAGVKMAASLWFATMYAALYGFYVFFAVADGCAEMRAQLPPLRDDRGMAGKGRFVHRLVPVFLFLAVIPAALVGLDLGLFRDVRAAQGLGIEQTVLLDVIASLLIITLSLFFVSRSLTRPVRLLAQAQEQLESGDLQASAPVVSDDELGRLTSAFNRMVRGLRERQRLREAFERFTGAHVVEAVIGERTLVPVAREATVLFTDIEGFATICEGLTPEETFNKANEYVAMVASVLREHGGTVNNFIGDSVMAVFNLPQEQESFAIKAVVAALAVQQRLAQRRTLGAFSPPTRIGIATGPVHAGIIGDSGRNAYTVYGHTVNLAARLEQANKEHRTSVLVDARTRELAAGAGKMTRIGEMTLKGFARPCEMFAVAPV
jgi:class 3 adenylate cyclase